MLPKNKLLVHRVTAFAMFWVLVLPLPVSRAGNVLRQEHPDGSTSVRIGVLGLFHPRDFTVAAVPGHALILHTDNERELLEASSGIASAHLHLSASGVDLAAGPYTLRSQFVRVTGRTGEPAEFSLAIPGKITRRYRGTLEIHATEGELIAIVTMDLETAVASIVAAENLPDTPMEALKAQAIASRSYLVSGRGRHQDFDFCDTTHCQFLREPPNTGTAITRAAEATRGMLLTYNSRPFAALYTRSCSGRTHTPAELGFHSDADAYAYYAADCKFCRSRPARWETRISDQDAALLHSADESSRLKLARRLGWSTVPSNDFKSSHTGKDVLLQGTGYGHGIGLCQSGAKAMAERGANFREILLHYYPNTNIVGLMLRN